MLEALGLDTEVERVYRHLLGYAGLNRAQVAEALGWSEGKVADALGILTDLRLVDFEGEPPTLIRPVSPDVGLAALLARSESELRRRQHQIETTRTAVATLAREYSSRADQTHVIYRLEGGAAVQARLTELAQMMRQEWLSFLPGGVRRDTDVGADKPHELLALERGVALCHLFPEGARNNPVAVEYVRWLSGVGGQPRIIAALPMMMVIVDRECALIPIDPSDCRKGALELRSPGAVATTRVLFQQFWSVATPWTAAAAHNEHGLTAQEQQLLRYLACGHTDDMASRQLGVSVRTVRRISAELMTKLQARSRFEAGVRAAKLGWI